MAWVQRPLSVTMGLPKMNTLMKSINCLAMQGEEFRELPGFEGLISISNLGRVYSHPRKVKKFCGLSKSIVTQSYDGKFLKLYDSNCGYLKFRFGANGKKYSMLLSRAILVAFVGPPENGQLACHNDSDVTNNRLENLRWDSQKGNMKDREVRGLYPKGEFHHGAKIPVELVDQLQKGEISPVEAAKLTGFTYHHLWRISKGQSWKHRMVG